MAAGLRSSTPVARASDPGVRLDRLPASMRRADGLAERFLDCRPGPPREGRPTECALDVLTAIRWPSIEAPSAGSYPSQCPAARPAVHDPVSTRSIDADAIPPFLGGSPVPRLRPRTPVRATAVDRGRRPGAAAHAPRAPRLGGRVGPASGYGVARWPGRRRADRRPRRAARGGPPPGARCGRGV